MVSSREIIEIINKRIEETRSTSVISALEGIVSEIEKLEDREMQRMYAEYMRQDTLAAKWSELELELERTGR